MQPEMTTEQHTDTQNLGNKITPFMHPLIKELVSSETDLLNQMKELHEGPVHLIFPQIMEENIRRMQDFYGEFDFETRIYFTFKPNKSSVFARQAHACGINIDVSSLHELEAALAAGFTGERIGCTNTKNREYIWLAVQHGALISVDSEHELDVILGILNKEPRIKNVRILLRISDVQSRDRDYKEKVSKFGIATTDLEQIYSKIEAEPRIELKGFHFHNTNRLSDLQAGFIDHFMLLMEDAIHRGFDVDIINIGGGMRTRVLEDLKEWELFLEKIEAGLVTKQDTGTWRRHAFGMYLNDRGRVSGREGIQGNLAHTDYQNFIREALENDLIRERPLKDIIAENMFSLQVEPGWSLLQQCGITLMRINGVKKSHEGDNLILVDGNIYNISSFNTQFLVDPIIINKNPDNQPFEGYLSDNLCNERGILNKRRLTFQSTPQAGDVLCMLNTAAYISDFEDASPHMHPMGQKYVLTKGQNNKWGFQGESTYRPQFIEG